MDDFPQTITTPVCHPTNHILQPLVQENNAVPYALELGKAEPTRIKDKATTSLEQVGREAHFSAVPAGLQ